MLATLTFATVTSGPLAIRAQELSATKGGLAGLVTDSSGAVVPGASVSAVGNSDTKKATTNDQGRWQILDLTPGAYSITVEREGFSKTETKSVGVEINRVNSVSLTLKTGAVAETVQVDATSTSIDTGSTALGSNLTQNFYSNVPVARNVGSLFYTAPGVANSGGTGNSNPSINGATGLENQYIADGVNITDGGYGGLGVVSPVYGSLGTGINLTFIEEVQVKTGAFEPKYGKGDGGIIQIVTKSGGTSYHGAVGAFFAPDAFSAGQRYADDYFNRVNVHGKIASEPQYDTFAEFGGYVPSAHLKDRLFFYGAYNPGLNKVLWRAPSVAGLYDSGAFTNKTTLNSWAAKVTFKLNEATSLDASAFGDPSKTNAGYGVANEDKFPFNPNLNLANTTGFSRWTYGTRSETLHLTSSISPTLQVDLTGSAKKSNFTEVGLGNAYNVVDQSTVLKAGSYTMQGLGIFQNPITHDYGFGADAEKTLSFHGQHTFSLGWGFSHSIYSLNKGYSGGRSPFPSTNIAGIATSTLVSNPEILGSTFDAAFQLKAAPASCSPTDCPYLTGTSGVPTQVYLKQVRGIYSSPTPETSEVYHAIYGNDNYALNRFVTFNLGLRWEEEQLNGTTLGFVFVDNWSPRLGINIDPFGDRKSKIFFNWGRYTQSMPQDGALRDLANELSITTANWKPQADGGNSVILNGNGSAQPVLDAAHLISGDPAAGTLGGKLALAGGASPVFVEHNTKLDFEEEYVGGIERQVGGFVLSARYMDRRLLRVIEDNAGASPEGNLSGNIPQNYVLGNVSSKTDYFINEQEVAYPVGGSAPAGCPDDYGQQFDSVGAAVGGACGLNPTTAGLPTPDGLPDGFPDPRRHYQSLNLEANKSFSHNFMIHANYTWAKLFGNYEGLYRNDNNQIDPSINSLFDFTNGVLGLLGDQYSRGYLNTDRRQTGNLYGSYVIPSGFAKRFTGGIGLRGSAGTPISKLGAHPVYDDAGEIPIGGRGAVGTTPSNYQLDLHADYPLQLGEKYKVKFTFDTFNVTNSRSLAGVDQDIAISYGSPDADYLKPIAFQRAFYGRGSVRFEF